MESRGGDIKARVTEVAAALFSQKGYDGVGMSEIAKCANINKPLIYYYFPGKQAILDHILNGFFDEITGIGLDFIQNSIARLIKEGRMDIYPDRIHFFEAEDMQAFLRQSLEYYRHAMQHMLKRRDVLRIIMAEALRTGSQRDALFRLFRLTEQGENNPLYKAIYDADADFSYSERAVFHKFFFSLLPMLNFVVFHEEYKALSGMNDSQMLQSFLQAFSAVAAGHYVGTDIMLEPPLNTV